MVTVTHPAESDGINEILEGAHRAVSTGAMRFTELLAWRGRDHAYDRADAANHELDQVLAEDLVDHGRQVLAEEMADRHVTITDPDNRFGSPAYDGPVSGAADRLVDGTYVGVDEHGNDITVAVADAQTGAVGEVDYIQRAAMQAQVDAALDDRAGFTGEDVDNVLYGWAAQRNSRNNRPDPYDSEYWRDWAIMEADDSQLAAVTHHQDKTGSYRDRIAAAYTNLQGQVEQAARTDGPWREAADARALSSAEHLYADGLRQSAQARGPFASTPAQQADSAQTHATQTGAASNRTATGTARTGDTEVDEALALHDMMFTGRETPTRPGRWSHKPAASQDRGIHHGTDRGMSR